MDPTGRYTTQQRIKIIEAYFATKSVLLTQRQCRRDLGRNNVPNRRTIERLVAKFRETGSVTDARKGHSGRHRSAKVPENIQNFRERLKESPRKSTPRLSQETGISRTSVLYGKNLRSSWKILKTDVLEIPVSCERRDVDFLGDS